MRQTLDILPLQFYVRRASACVVRCDILRNIFRTIPTDKSQMLSHLAKRAVEETASCIGVILNYVFESK